MNAEEIARDLSIKISKLEGFEVAKIPNLIAAALRSYGEARAEIGKLNDSHRYRDEGFKIFNDDFETVCADRGKYKRLCEKFREVLSWISEEYERGERKGYDMKVTPEVTQKHQGKPTHYRVKDPPTREEEGMIEIEMWRDGPHYFWRCGIYPVGGSLSSTSEINEQIYAQMMGWC